MKNTLKDITNICVLILIFLYIYALLGLEMYSLRVAMDDGQPPQSNFNSLYSAMVTVFIMLANDGWAKIYFVHYRVTDGLSTSVYFLSLIFIGRFIVMNLFVSILVENFEELSSARTSSIRCTRSMRCPSGKRSRTSSASEQKLG